MKYNDAQRKAIETQGKNILISASAGAGKTSVLIARLMHMIQEDQQQVNELLAMTFSEAAAAEMKKRLSDSLHKLLELDPYNQHIKQQVASMDSANISTIHGFCLDVMKSYYYVIGLEKQRIEHPMDEAQSAKLKQSALEETLQYAYTKQEFKGLIGYFSNRIKSNGSLEDYIVGLATLANSKSNPTLFLETCKQCFSPIQSMGELPTNVVEAFFLYYLSRMETMLELLQSIQQQLDGVLDDKDSYYQVAFVALQQQNYGLFHENFLLGLACKMPPSTKAEGIKELVLLEKALLEVAFDQETLLEQHNNLYPYASVFVEITATYLKCYQQAKEQEGVIDFDDMEHYALEILKADNGYVSKKYKDKFKMIMVDEFQDSNDIQDELIYLIASENNVFRVGDIKQSIYGFRHALPSIMKALIKQRTSNDEVIYLQHNYRSSKKIVDFNNELFSVLMNAKRATLSYSKEDAVATGLASQEAYMQEVVLHLLNDKALKQESILTKTQLKASYIAHLVETLHERYAYKDIVVLVRSNAKMVDVSDALQTCDIPNFYNKSKGFYDSQSVQSVISFLQALNNPHDDLAFVSMLTSTFYKKDANELAMLSLQRNKQSYYHVVKEEAYMQSFEQLRQQLSTITLSELLCALYEINQFYREYANAQEKANLDLLYEMACSYEKEQAMTIYGFLTFLKQQKDTEVAEAMPIGANDDVVRIMSIHKSKGLQFKVVLLFSSSEFRQKENSNVVLYDQDLGLGMQYYDQQQRVLYPTITTLAMIQKKHQEFLEEEMRLLYVATTRAQEEMHIIDVGEQEEVPKFSNGEFYKMDGYTGWIRKAFSNSITGLLSYQYIDTMWEIKGRTTRKQNYQELVYQRSSDTYTLATPTGTKQAYRKVPEFTWSTFDTYERGNKLHKMVEHLGGGRWTSDEIAKVSNQYGMELNTHDMEVLETLSGTELMMECFKAKEVYHEFPFMVKKDGILQHGFMDFLAVDQEVTMIDFKSDRHANATQLKERYLSQILAYREALHELYPTKSIHTYLYSFELEKFIEIGGSHEL